MNCSNCGKPFKPKSHGFRFWGNTDIKSETKCDDCILIKDEECFGEVK